MTSVSVRIPTILRSYTCGIAEVIASPGTLREVIAGVDASYPGIAGRILDEAGKLRRFVNVYVAEEESGSRRDSTLSSLKAHRSPLSRRWPAVSDLP